MSIDSRYKIPIDASANVHSVSAVGEQYLDLVSTGNPGKLPSRRVRPSPRARCPARSARRWTPPTAAWRCCPRTRSASLLDETSQAVGGLGPALQRLVDSTQAIVGDFKANIDDVDDIIEQLGTHHRQPGQFR